MSPEHYCVHAISGVSWSSFGFFEAMLKNPAASSGAEMLFIPLSPPPEWTITACT